MRPVVRACLSWLVAGTALLVGQSPTPPDLVLHNARIYTADARNSVAHALAITGNRLTQVGTDAEVLARRGGSTRVIDLDGGTVVPGLHDAHGHVVGLGASLQNVDLVGTRSFEEVVARIRRRVAAARPGEWVLGRGWDQNDWPERSWPVHDLLTDAAPENPVYIERIDGHAGLANRKAMDAAGLTRSIADPVGGRILRAGDGMPTGVLIDTAATLVTSRIPPVGREQLEAQITAADRELRRLGITTVHDAGAGGETIDAYKRLVDAGTIKTRLYVMLGGSLPQLTRLVERGPLIDAQRHRLDVRAIKLYADGALGSRGAALLEPYDDEPTTSGLLTTPPEDVYAQAAAAAKAGFQVAIHAIGDRANRQVLDAFERVQREVPGSRKLRPRIEHAQVLDSRDIPRFGRLGIIASMQPMHATSDMPWAPVRIGVARVEEGAYAWRALIDTGAVVAAGSDFPVESANPLLGIHAAVARQDASGMPAGGWTPRQRMTRVEALAAFTRHAAYASFAESLTGSIEVGKLADLVVLSADIMRIPPSEILKTTVRMTVIGGEIVYQTP